MKNRIYDANMDLLLFSPSSKFSVRYITDTAVLTDTMQRYLMGGRVYVRPGRRF